jgi:predicted RNA binding protein YcfA (HicA-like mRNA interferase family)
MKLPRDLSGAELVKVLCRDFGYRKINQEGSHMILQTDVPRSHRLSVPDHSPLRTGTLNAILRSVADTKGIDKADLLSKL